MDNDEDGEEFIVIVDEQKLSEFVRSLYEDAIARGYTFECDDVLRFRATVH